MRKTLTFGDVREPVRHVTEGHEWVTDGIVILDLLAVAPIMPANFKRSRAAGLEIKTDETVISGYLARIGDCETVTGESVETVEIPTWKNGKSEQVTLYRLVSDTRRASIRAQYHEPLTARGLVPSLAIMPASTTYCVALYHDSAGILRAVVAPTNDERA